MKKALFFITICIVAAIVSCDYKKGLLPPKAEPIPVNACDSIRYANGVKAIIDNNCITCHSGPAPSMGIDLATYANCKARALDGSLKLMITSSTNPMPPSGAMQKSQIDSITCWIDKGAPN